MGRFSTDYMIRFSMPSKRIPSRETWKAPVTSQSWARGGGRAAAIRTVKAGALASIRMCTLDGVLQDFACFGVDADFVFLIPAANDERVAQSASSRFLL